MEVDLKILKKSGLFLEDFMILALINEEEDPTTFEISNKYALSELENELWIKSTEGGYELRGKGRELFENKQSSIDFDEFWDAFPSNTPSGRALRAVNKVWAGKPARDYVTCKKKYLAKIKTIEAHKKIINIIRARIASKDYEYMNNMETYINQEKWQQDIRYLTIKPLTGKVNEMS